MHIQCYSVICRPSDHTEGRPRAEIRTRAGRPRGSILLWRRFTFPIFQLFIYGYAVGALFFLLLSKTENSEICGYITMTTEEQQEDGKHRKSATINQNKIENIVTPWPRRFEQNGGRKSRWTDSVTRISTSTFVFKRLPGPHMNRLYVLGFRLRRYSITKFEIRVSP